jgi:hypothetical protein
MLELSWRRGSLQRIDALMRDRDLKLHVSQTESGTLITTPEFPELYLIDRDREVVFGDLLRAASELWEYNKGERARAEVLPYGRGEPITEGLAVLDDGTNHVLRLKVRRKASRSKERRHSVLGRARRLVARHAQRTKSWL